MKRQFFVAPLVSVRRGGERHICMCAAQPAPHFAPTPKRSTPNLIFCFILTRATHRASPLIMIHSAMGRLVSLAAVFLGQAGFASAAPTCTRIASQWAVVFPAECTVWFQQAGRRQGGVPESCSQVCMWFVIAYARVGLLLFYSLAENYRRNEPEIGA